MKYEFTLTLRPSLYNLTPKEQFNKLYDTLRDILKHWTCSCIAELTKENNVHYHGMIELTDFKDRDSFLNRFRKYNKWFGRKSCTQLKNEPEWILYIRKDMKETEEILGKSPQVDDDFEIFGDLNPKFIDHFLKLGVRTACAFNEQRVIDTESFLNQ